MPFGFVGGIYDADTGLTQFGAREYGAEVGRWTARDPSLFGGGTNVYAYANSSPARYVDINGRQATDTATNVCLRRPALCLAADLAETGLVGGAVAGAGVVVADTFDFDLQDCADGLGDLLQFTKKFITNVLPFAAVLSSSLTPYAAADLTA